MQPGTECQYCGSSKSRGSVDVLESMFGWRESFSYRKCAMCGSLWLAEIPSDMAKYYPENYYSIESDPEVAFGGRRRRIGARGLVTIVLWGPQWLARLLETYAWNGEARKIAGLVAAVRRGGLPSRSSTRILDVGSGSGALPYLLACGGIRDVVGIDPFIGDDRRFANKAVVLKTSLREVEGTFDMVMFHHSLEHVHDVSADLRLAVEHLSENGAIVVRAPNADSEAFARYGPDWFQLDAPRHISIPTREGMRRLADRAGLRIRFTYDDSSAIQFWRSEQVRRGLPMQSPHAAATEAGERLFSNAQIAAWQRESRRLNRMSRGDQTVWVLERAASESPTA